LSSLNGRRFSSPDFLIVTKKKFPWSADIVKTHQMSWLTVADLNGDGFDDIVFSLPVIDLGGGLRDGRGEVYVVLGNTRANLGSTWDFSSKPPSFTFYGQDQDDWAGFSLASGDINGDGRADLLIGAPQADGPLNAFTDGGEVYGITFINFGQSSMILSESNVNLFLYGEAGERQGISIAIGNFNGDAYKDIAVAPKIISVGYLRAVFGSSSIFGTKRLSLNSNWKSAYTLNPYGYINVLFGDLNGDGIDELVSSESRSMIYITYGSLGTISTLAETKIYGFAFPWDNTYGFASTIADFDKDGYKDLASLAPSSGGRFKQYTTPVGELDIVWGRSAKLPSTVYLSTENTHFSLFGSDGTGPTGLISNFQGPWNSRYGSSPLGMDLNGDGNPEIFFGAGWTQNGYLYEVKR